MRNKSKEENKTLDEYVKQYKCGFYVGVLFLVLSAIFCIVGIATKNYNVFYGVLLQIFAGILLTFSNTN